MAEHRDPTDPLEVLRSAPAPLAPDPAFATRLRARLHAALHPDPPGGTPMSQDARTLAAPDPATVAAPIGVTPYLIVPEADAAISWYASALDAQVVGEPIVMDDGRIGHAELFVNGGMLYLASAFPEQGFHAPGPDAPATVSLHLTVPDVDALTARAGSAGADIERPPYDAPYGRGAAFRDPFGHRWLLHESVEAVAPDSARAPETARAPKSSDVDLAAAFDSGDGPRPPGERPGDVTYLTLLVPDSRRARAFYGAVLGWTFSPGHVDDGWQVEGVHPMTGMWGGGFEVETSTMMPMYQVEDIEVAVVRVRELGGIATDPERQPYGLSSECVDDQGGRFYLGQT